MPTYIVECPTRGFQVYTVKANSAAEARRLVIENDISIVAVAGEFDWMGKPRSVVLDKRRPPKADAK